MDATLFFNAIVNFKIVIVMFKCKVSQITRAWLHDMQISISYERHSNKRIAIYRVLNTVKPLLSGSQVGFGLLEGL